MVTETLTLEGQLRQQAGHLTGFRWWQEPFLGLGSMPGLDTIASFLKVKAKQSGQNSSFN